MNIETEAFVNLVKTKYLNIPVKIVKRDGFFTKCFITDICGDYILCKTTKETMIETLMRIEDISVIVPIIIHPKE